MEGSEHREARVSGVGCREFGVWLSTEKPGQPASLSLSRSFCLALTLSRLPRSQGSHPPPRRHRVPSFGYRVSGVEFLALDFRIQDSGVGCRVSGVGNLVLG